VPRIYHYEYTWLCFTSNQPFKKQFDDIMKLILEVGLPSRVSVVKFHRPLYMRQIYSLKHPYITQGVRKIENLFNQSQPMTFKLIDATWIGMKGECGIGPNFLEEQN
jgi:hypothetical protein